MSLPARNLVISANDDGLHIHIVSRRLHKAVDEICLSWESGEIKSVVPATALTPNNSSCLNVYGLVGILTVFSQSYLIAITDRKPVAEIGSKHVYVLDNVAIIPITSATTARKAIEQAQRQASRSSGDSSDREEPPSEPNSADETEEEPNPVTPGPSNSDGEPNPTSTTIAQDVIGRKGQYGRFANEWFSRNGWSLKIQGMSSEVSHALASPTSLVYGTKQTDAVANPTKSSIGASLVPKLLKTTKLMLTSQTFFFSYDFDITRRIGTQTDAGRAIPLHNRVDPNFFWNQRLVAPLVEAGLDSFVLPVMQGFIGQRVFTTSVPDRAQGVAEVLQDPPEETERSDQPVVVHRKADSPSDFRVTILSRKSVKRPGLRYLRRGVDTEGNVANYVETEQILFKALDDDNSKVFSFVQVRGSIPLFFSQSPYSLKPVPTMQQSFDANRNAFRRHIEKISQSYGRVQIISLVDKRGGEVKIGQEYEKHFEDLNDRRGSSEKELGFEWFDFHDVCKGMKFENVSILVGNLEEKLDSFGETLETGGKLENRQSGVFRTNCMDCLDRTNVVQSAFARFALERELKSFGVPIDLQNDLSTRWFNSLWADNGDALSKAYSSTAALKGDYTRNRRRDYRGALNDFGLTLNRMFNNVFNDSFYQTAIDFLLGNVSERVFEEFEASMATEDPGISMDKVRQNAIDVSVKLVIEDRGEEFRGGWPILTPAEPYTLRYLPFQEVLLLITDAALYSVKFDWNTEKVAAFERVDLRSVMKIYRGTYITSTVAASYTDESRNTGFVVQYKPGSESVVRVNTRSMSTASVPTRKSIGGSAEDQQQEQKQFGGVGSKSSAGGDVIVSRNNQKDDSVKILAFKALQSPPRPQSTTATAGNEQPTATRVDESPISLIKTVCDEIARAAGQRPEDLVEEKEIISLGEARKSTGYLEQWGHSLKKLIWA